jgi:DNA-binding CsgD family transcriptional regulator/tetratricopeptide (TPR) repeat protein
MCGQSDRALHMFNLALANSHDPRQRSAIHRMSGVLGSLALTLGACHDELVSAAAPEERIDKERASLLLAHASLAALGSGRIRDAGATGDRAVATAPDGSPASVTASVALGLARLTAGRVCEASRLLERFLVQFDTEGVSQRWLGVAEHAANGLMWTERFTDAAAVLDGAIDCARHSRAPALLPLALTVRGELSFLTGDWDRAIADTWDAASLARYTGQVALHSYSLVNLARVEGALGRAADARERLLEAQQLAIIAGNRAIELGARATSGFVELSCGDLDAARHHLEVVARSVKQPRHPSAAMWQADLVEVMVRLGAGDSASSAQVALDELQARLPGAWPRAAASRGRAMSSPDFDQHMKEALVGHETLPMPFERARTELCFGERLRRAQRRSAADVHLRAAKSVFDRVGARPWAARADAELAACGDESARPNDGLLSELTPQELRVASAIATGATNQEAAGSLYLSRRTVECHLASIYRKLGIHSRTRLVAELARETSFDAERQALSS